MNKVLKNSIKNLKKILSSDILQYIKELLYLKDEIDFIITASKYIFYLKQKNITLTYPQISDNYEISMLCNPNLLDKIPVSQIVPSNVTFDDDGRIFILTGPNSGGKSVYLQAIGISQLMFQMGLPVAATHAQMKIYGAIHTHFTNTVIESTEGRLENESKRLKTIIDNISSDSLLLMDETFSSTSAYDGIILAAALLKYLQKTGCDCIYATHLHELTQKYGELNSGETGLSKIDILSALVVNGKRSYEIVRTSVSDMNSSLAKDILIENGLKFLIEG